MAGKATESVTSPGTRPSAPTTEPPRSTSPESPTARPSTRPALTASPASGGPNTNVAVEGTGFRYPGGYVIRMDWGQGIGSRPAPAIPQSNGEIRVEFTVPDGTPPGRYHVRVFEMTNVLASATFTVTG
jgi:hypothetical protein